MPRGQAKGKGPKPIELKPTKYGGVSGNRGTAPTSRGLQHRTAAGPREPLIARGQAKGKGPKAPELKPTEYFDPARSKGFSEAGPTLATASAPIDGALTRFLLRILPYVNLFLLAHLAIEIIGAIKSYYREKGIEEALLRGLEDKIPKLVTHKLKDNRNAICKHYVIQWNQRNSSAVFLYVSPRIEIFNIATPDSGGLYKFKVDLPVKNVASDLVSTRFIKFQREDINDLDKDLGVTLRWSFPQPLFTPFDIFLARIDLISTAVVDDWVRLYLEEKSPAPSLIRDFYETISLFATITATLKFEPYFGFSQEDRLAFKPELAGAQRREHLRKLVSLIRKKLIPTLTQLLQKRTIASGSIRLSFATEIDPIKDEVEGSNNGIALVDGLDEMADDMGGLYSKYLEYERFENLRIKNRIEEDPNSVLGFTLIDESIAFQAQQDLATLLDRVREFLPASLKPSREKSFGRSTGQIELELPATP
jgi:hypothetical protein